jgi:hypothetical protein
MNSKDWKHTRAWTLKDKKTKTNNITKRTVGNESACTMVDTKYSWIIQLCDNKLLHLAQIVWCTVFVLRSNTSRCQKKKDQVYIYNTWINCWLEAGDIRGISDFTPSACTNWERTDASLRRVARQFTAIGTERVGWDGFLSCLKQEKCLSLVQQNHMIQPTNLL